MARTLMYIVGSVKEDCTYTLKIDSKCQSYVRVDSKGTTGQDFTIVANGKNKNKVSITFTYDQNDKKGKFFLTIPKSNSLLIYIYLLSILNSINATAQKMRCGIYIIIALTSFLPISAYSYLRTFSKMPHSRFNIFLVKCRNYKGLQVFCIRTVNFPEYIISLLTLAK